MVPNIAPYHYYYLYLIYYNYYYLIFHYLYYYFPFLSPLLLFGELVKYDFIYFLFFVVVLINSGVTYIFSYFILPIVPALF